MLIREMLFLFRKRKQVYTRVTLKKLLKTINCTEDSFCSNKRFCGSVITGLIRFRSHDSGPTIQVARNLLAWKKCESVVTLASSNPGPCIECSNPTEGHYLIFWSDCFSFKNSPLSPLVYSLAKLIPYFNLVSYTLSNMQSTAEYKNFGHPNLEYSHMVNVVF